MTKVDLDDLALAVRWVADGMALDHEAWVERSTGVVRMYSPDQAALCGPMPTNAGGHADCVPVPDRRELGLGTELVFDFARDEMPDAVDAVRAVFRRKGAYGRFRDMLERQGLLERWYAYEEAREMQALHEWCEAQGLVPAYPARMARPSAPGRT